jgi:peptidoglycan hydrolase CwlO-like protein
METIYIILGILLIIGTALLYAYKTGKLTDKDGDFIPDELEERIERVKEELVDVKNAIKEVGNQIGDIPKAIKGETRTGRKPNN